MQKSARMLLASAAVAMVILWLMHAAHVVEAQGASVSPLGPVTPAGTGIGVNLNTVLAGRSSNASQARWCQITAPSGNASSVKFGGASILSAGDALLIAAGGTFFMPTLQADTRESTGQHLYNLNNWYLIIAIGDTATVTCAN